jgi:hypothetical protein
LKKDSDVKSKIAKLYLIIGDKDKYNELVKELKDSKNPSDIRASQYLMMENSKDADSSRLKENSKDADSKPLKKENTKEKK